MISCDGTTELLPDAEAEALAMDATAPRLTDQGEQVCLS
jgi:hypothetical protein